MRLIRSAKLLVRDSEGKFLVLQRSGTHPRHPHWPDLPGGDIEEGETFEIGLARELQEETGLAADMSTLNLLCASTTPHESGDSITHLLYHISLEQNQPDIMLSWEHSGYSWQPVDTLTGFEEVFQRHIDYIRQYKLL